MTYNPFAEETTPEEDLEALEAEIKEAWDVEVPTPSERLDALFDKIFGGN